MPAAARVRAIKLTAGYTRALSGGDLFTMNPRLRRVRVERGGVTLGEFDLDPARRDLQTLPVDAPGGDFRIEVLAVVAGTRAAWREACVSELEVWGDAAYDALVRACPVGDPALRR